ncbi:mechanosensitive ion channel family protein [Allomuricauda sp. SCSIO 65647]|uniref:mechanosensitive ion channel family protein n=1 Tax=Allomuricauda sp. SCSIO 65647 TaxID=2908843 RepID=UPI001F1C7F45|nr:mechanosensitive ion channel domain-containing protein [Muricauda sp. SCSIO 65647]UJH68138.1 mechanosensitive ion channel [Muricauda sp. SCSIO 65647]
METYKDVLSESLGNMLSGAAEILPKIILGVIGLIVAWLVLKIVLFILKRILKAAKIDTVSQKVTEAKLFGDREVKIDLLKIILGTVRILLILLFAIIIADVLGLTPISEGIMAMFGYLPTLISAILILAGGLYLASLAKKGTLALLESMGVGGSKFISNVLFYLITFFISVTALNQAGINTDIITSNFTMILGAFLVAVALGFGLGARDVFSDLMKMFYMRKIYMVGDKISFDNVEGTIEAIDNTTITLKTRDGKLIVPIRDLTANRVSLKQQ